MNRKLLALAVAAALAAPIAANAAPIIYGNINTSVEFQDEMPDAVFDAMVDALVNNDPLVVGGDSINVNSNTSRIGIKGEEKLTDSLNAIYKLEWGFSSDSNDNVFSARDRYVGLQSADLGTVRVGRLVSPFRAIEGNVDQFNYSATLDMGNFISGQGRINNAIAYTSPKFADAFTVNVALQQGEANGLGGDGLADGVAVSVDYQQNGLYLAAAYKKDMADGALTGSAAPFVDLIYGASFENQTNDMEGLRLVASYSTDNLTVGGLYQQVEHLNMIDEDSLVLSTALKLSAKNTVKAQVVVAEFEDTMANVSYENTVIAVGLDHALSQFTTVYGQVGLSQFESPFGDFDGTVIGVGVSHNF